MPTLDELISSAAKKVEDTGGADDIFEQIAELYPDEDLDAARRPTRRSSPRLQAVCAEGLTAGSPVDDR